jgi:hypothetical protein
LKPKSLAPPKCAGGIAVRRIKGLWSVVVVVLVSSFVLAVPAAEASEPSPPQNLSADAGDGQVFLEWDPPADDGGSPVTVYPVIVRVGSNWLRTIETPWTSLTVLELTNGVTYTFRVYARNADGDSSYTQVSATPTGAATPGLPDPPLNLEAAPGNGQVFLEWDPPVDDGGSPITVYRVVVRVGSSWLRTVETAGTSLSVLELGNGVEYTFRVYARNANGDSTYAQVSATPVGPGVPGPPANLTATSGDGQVHLSWDPPVSDGGSAITVYPVIVRAGGEFLRTIETPWTSLDVLELTNGVTYTFRVYARNANGDSSYAETSEMPFPPLVPGQPGPVLGLTATPGNTQVKLDWSPPTIDGGSQITWYHVNVYSEGALLRTEDLLGETTITFTGLSNGRPYYFGVDAENEESIGPMVFTPIVMPRTIPGAPRDVSAYPGDKQATVSWRAPADDGGADVTSYSVVVRTVSGVVRTLSAEESPLLVTVLTNGVNYTFTVEAANEAGTGPASAPSAPVTPYEGTHPPGAPTSVSGVAGIGQVVVSWSAPADNGGSPITGYVIMAYAEGALVQTVTASGGPLTVTGLTDGVGHAFTVSAVNAVGTGPPSGPSPAVTPLPPEIHVASPSPSPPVLAPSVPSRAGYWMVGSDGVVYPFGDARLLGHAPVGAAVAVDLEPTPSGNGYWVIDDTGQIFSYGDAVFHGGVSRGRLLPGEKATSVSSASSGAGYWIFTSRGRVLPFGNAPFLGDLSGVVLNGPVLDSIATPSGLGYYMVASDGGVFAFGDAAFAGSMGSRRLNAPVQSLVPDGDGRGYWLVASDGGIFAFEAPFRGSMGNVVLNQPVTGMVRAGTGYLMVGEDGGIFDFSGTPDGFKGSLGANPPLHPITSVAVLE